MPVNYYTENVPKTVLANTQWGQNDNDGDGDTDIDDINIIYILFKDIPFPLPTSRSVVKSQVILLLYKQKVVVQVFIECGKRDMIMTTFLKL